MSYYFFYDYQKEALAFQDMNELFWLKGPILLNALPELCYKDLFI